MEYQRVFRISGLILGSILVATLFLSCESDGEEGVLDDVVDAQTQSDILDAGFPQPVIPEPSMRCPFFVTGIQEIMLLTVQMWVGKKNPNAEGALLFYWHGAGGFSNEAEVLPAVVKDEILSQGGIIVSLQDTSGADFLIWNDSDFEFTDLIAACAVREYNINPRRIYSTGCSAGGLQTAKMVFRRSSYLASAVTNSGGLILPSNESGLQDPSHVPPVMSMHGSAEADVVVVSFTNTSRTLVRNIVDLGGFAINCDHQRGHCEGSEQDYTAAWQFLKDHPFGIENEPYANGLPSTFPQYCEIIR